MTAIVFLDTSVLLNVLDVPGKNADRTAISARFKERVAAGDAFVIPLTAVIEVGNHLAQLPDGGARRHRSERFVTFLRGFLDGKMPWVVPALVWDHAFLAGLLQGDPTPESYVPSLVELATQQVGAGDAAILHEMRRYRSRIDVPSGQSVELWSLDAGLAAYT